MNHVRNLYRRTVLALGLMIAAIGLVSCATTKAVDVPTNLSPAKYFQLVQEMIDHESYANALVYLDEFARRNAGSQDLAITDKLLEGEYLVAQIAYKQNRLEDSRALFAALLKKYEGVPEKASSPPQWIRVLCAKMIDIITKKLPAPKPSPASADASAISPAK